MQRLSSALSSWLEVMASFLSMPKNIRELKAYKLHILFLGHADNVVLTVFAHLYSPSLANCYTNNVNP